MDYLDEIYKISKTYFKKKGILYLKLVSIPLRVVLKHFHNAESLAPLLH